MSEELLPGVGPVPASAPNCPWCSAALPAATEERCPSCGAMLREAEGSEVPGVTRVDHEALLRARAPVQRSRGLIGWLSGDYEPEQRALPPGTFEPPDEAVRREMLRLELAALEAEVQARHAEAVALATADPLETEGPVRDPDASEADAQEVADEPDEPESADADVAVVPTAAPRQG